MPEALCVAKKKGAWKVTPPFETEGGSRATTLSDLIWTWQAKKKPKQQTKRDRSCSCQPTKLVVRTLMSGERQRIETKGKEPTLYS
jgi:hypothetical protein